MTTRHLAWASVALLVACLMPLPARAELPAPRLSVLKVTVTSQGYNLFRPWQRQRRASKVGLGAIVDERHILVTANLVENAVLVELERLDSGEQGHARVVCVDYMANLALLECSDRRFMQGLEVLPLGKPPKLGDTVTAWQFEDNGTPFLTDGVLRSIDVAPYPFGERSMLVYQVEISLSRLTSSYVIPMVTDDGLIGLLMNYNGGTRIMALVASPVIAHFLTDWADGTYDGFPEAGLGFAFLDDPQLRQFLGLTGGNGGVYVTNVRPGSPAANAGLQRGDVLLAIDDAVLDRNGEYVDPDFGKIGLAHLISTRSSVGQVRYFQIVRDGKPQTVRVPLGALGPMDYPIPPYVKDQAPVYLIQGGLVFLELSREYLTQWGNDWQRKAPLRLVYAEANQWETLAPGQRLVIVSHVLPGPVNVGYESLDNQVVVSVNGLPVHSLADVAVAFGQPQNGFHVVQTETYDRRVYFAAETMAEENGRIQQLYRIPALSRLAGAE